MKWLFTKNFDNIVLALIHKDEKIFKNIENIGILIRKVVVFEAKFIGWNPNTSLICAIKKVNSANKCGFAAAIITQKEEIFIKAHPCKIKTSRVDKDNLFKHYS